jgi:hypothetical protein
VPPCPYTILFLFLRRPNITQLITTNLFVPETMLTEENGGRQGNGREGEGGRWK